MPPLAGGMRCLPFLGGTLWDLPPVLTDALHARSHASLWASVGLPRGFLRYQVPAAEAARLSSPPPLSPSLSLSARLRLLL